MLHQAGSTTLDGASYGYDFAGNRVSKTNYLNNVTEGYGYDPIYQLTQVTQGASTTESYSYDAVGNRLSSLGVNPYSYNASNQLTATPSGSYTYDNNGNTLTDPSGKSYTWDFENRLVSSAVPGTGTVTFKYDPFGRRAQKSSALGMSNYLYDGMSLLEELDSAGNVLARYTHGAVIDEPLSEFRTGTASYYQEDGLGSVSSLTNASGVIANTYTFDSFGQPTAHTGTLVNPFQYAGREFDSETGLYYYRARYYSPETGRFVNEDLLDDPIARSSYAYVDDNPTGYIDPFGASSVDFVTKEHHVGFWDQYPWWYAGTAHPTYQLDSRCDEVRKPCKKGTEWRLTIHLEVTFTINYSSQSNLAHERRHVAFATNFWNHNIHAFEKFEKTYPTKTECEYFRKAYVQGFFAGMGTPAQDLLHTLNGQLDQGQESVDSWWESLIYH